MKNLSTLSLALTVSLISTLQTAEALPRNANGTVISGAATIVDTDANTTTINQTSDIAEINWSDFDIGSGQTVQFNVPRAQSLSVNRVTSGIASTIAGNLNSNGQVYLINEHGINFTNGALFNLPTIVASTIDTYNAEADAAQYAKVTFTDVSHAGIPDGAINKLVIVSPFVGFYQGVGTTNLSRLNDKEIYSANRATVNFSGANNTLSVDIPDNQPDITVPALSKLGIEVFGGGSTDNMALIGDRLKMVAKAVSVAQNIDALINLSSTVNSTVVVRAQDRVSNYPTPIDYAVDMYSAGHINLRGQVTLGLGISQTFGYRIANVKMVAEKNVFAAQLHGGINNFYVEAGDNIILNAFDQSDAPTAFLSNEGIYGSRTIKLNTGDITVSNTDINTVVLNDISTYAAGSFGHVNTYYASKDDYPTGDVALDTTLIADNIHINSAIDLTGAITERAFKTAVSLFSAPAPGETDIAHLNLVATGDVNVNANINMAGLGDVNVTSVNYNINGPVTVVASNETHTVVAPPPPPPPPPPAPDPAPVVPPVVVPPVVEDTPTFEELMEEVLTPKTIKLVKEMFFEKFSKGTKEVVAQVSNVEVKAETKVVLAPHAETHSVSQHDAPQKVEPTAVAAACADGVCTVLDKNDTLQTVDEAYLNKYRKGLKAIVDQVVNLNGMKDVVRF